MTSQINEKNPECLLILCLILFGLFFLVGCGKSDMPTLSSGSATGAEPLSVIPSSPVTTPTPVPTYDRQALQATVAALMRVLPTASPKPGWPPSKAQGEQQSDLYDRAIRTALAMNPPPNPIPHEWLPTYPAPSTAVLAEPTRLAGNGVIYDSVAQPGPLAHVINAWNTWHEQSTDHEVGVYAGESHLNPNQGMLAIEETDATGHKPIEFYSTPYRAGGLRIQNAVGERLVLEATSGAIFYFDVPSRQWMGFLPPTPGRTGTPVPAANVTPLPLAPPAFRPAGSGMLLEYGLTIDPPILDSIINQWYEEIDVGEVIPAQIRIFAGAEQANPTQGLLVLARYSPFEQPILQRYDTPQRGGTVRIIDAVGTRLTVRADNGRIFYFDVPSRRWVTP